MSFKTFIVFDTFGEYGHFRKFNTTTSPLSYLIPSPTAIAGLLGAILGIERENDKGTVSRGSETLRNVFSSENTKIAIRILGKAEKICMAFNLLDTGSPQSFFNITNRTQIEYELLKNPAFRIFLDWQHSKRDELIERIVNKRFHFNPYFGLSQFTANVAWVGEKPAEKLESNNFVSFNSVLNLSLLYGTADPVNFDQMKTQHIQVETLPLEMLPNRIISRYGEVLMETSGGSISAKPSHQSYFIENEGNVQLL